MAFRWKVPAVNADTVDPDAMHEMMVRRQIDDILGMPDQSILERQRAAQQAMRGYAPGVVTTPEMAASAQMRGFKPTPYAGPLGEYNEYLEHPTPDRTPREYTMARDQMLFQSQQEQRQQLQERYNQLTNELAQIDTQIAEVQKKYPGITNGREWRIAAKRAEIGDMSAYDNMMARGQNYGEKATGIENMLYDAMKLTWGLGSKSDEDRAFARNQIEVALRKAESEAARTGVKLPAIYDELKATLNPQQVTPGATPGATGKWAGKNAREIGNELESLKRAKNLHDSDLEELQKIADASSNKEETAEIQKLIKAYRGKTVEAGDRYAKKKARGLELLAQSQKKTDRKALRTWINGLSKEDRSAFNMVANITEDSLGKVTINPKL